MSSWSRVTFDPGDRDPSAVEADLLAADGGRDVEVVGDDVVMRVPAAPYELGDVDPPCRRALSFWQDDDAMAGGGLLYERVEGRYLLVDEHADTDRSFGRDARNYFLVEHGIRGYRN